ncbi:ABC transporter permease [Mesomycoplasma hyopneumoniae]|uniref:Oligopeptide transport system permease protein n=3 Tax=Mesomycoplasma hyopneumoniae TaxID=2099 RepID=Q601N3_MESH2|nr:ABC transporter permease [Mesomycoplasma hyopneumoniae]AAV27752.1 oligopeptide transport system permease protein [Mesomycoplasma hyopneumoniae 232]AGM21993.1 Oligopeptide transport system permease protein [Mesomycoplasma hyopneumoniae 168-L]ASU14371.1 Dipeptide transport system permease protein DppB [Mesomycoplasma hyopneumoniae]MXR34704.1 ABC transporter permease [Mesomycoplasma hyopneumoniae]MXR44483.1 ABC transporter permease [Mesomycoplasma hyopneumoniae]
MSLKNEEGQHLGPGSNILNFSVSKINPKSIDYNLIYSVVKHKKSRFSWLKYINFESFAFRFFKKITKIFLEFVIVAWIVATLVFLLIDSIPGDPSFLDGLTEAQKTAEKQLYGLDLPQAQRYFNYLWKFIHFDFGISYSLRPRVEISDFIWQRFFTSFSIGIVSVVLTILIGVPLGIAVGKNPGKFLDNFATIWIAVFSSIPSLVFALLLLIFGQKTGIPYIFNIQDFSTFVLPAIALSIGSVISYVRYIRFELNNELNSMHAKFAYLKNLTRNRFVWTHALKASLFPIATFFPIVVLGSFIGSIFVEKIFLITGSGGIMIDAIQSKDNNIILFLVIVYSLLTIISYTLRDISYELLDPRIRRRAK